MQYVMRVWKHALVLVADVLMIAIGYWLAFMLRFDGRIPQAYFDMFAQTLPLVLGIRFLCLWYFGLHRGLWRYASMRDLMAILRAATAGTVVIAVAIWLTTSWHGFPRSVIATDWMLRIVICGGSRFVIKVAKKLESGQGLALASDVQRVLLVGAGDTGAMIAREMLLRTELGCMPIGFIDNNAGKLHRTIHRLPVLGKTSQLPAIIRKHRVQQVVLTVPSMEGPVVRSIVHVCQSLGVRCRTVPSFADIVNRDVKVQELREINIDDLLRRDVVQLNEGQPRTRFAGKRILITGAAGSIGSELCRQAALCGPDELILFEQNETGLFFIESELRDEYPNLATNAQIGDICDRARVDEVFQQCQPDIVFHAAAYKHVPLMEKHPQQAILNNVIGTRILAKSAVEYDVEEFVMLSTDKAVSPASVMGCTKRAAELYIQALVKRGGTRFMAVRFGNVLGSQGSVVPIFQKQIAEGGPVTVTHPQMSRYFMTISEAAGLVIRASSIGKGGEIFVLDMGKQVKIVDLAEEMIKLSGYEPGRDIEIVYTGTRPGEKLYEELLSENEKPEQTEDNRIMMLRPGIDFANVPERIAELERAVRIEPPDQLLKRLAEIVPEYQAPREAAVTALGKKKEKSRQRVLIVNRDPKTRRMLAGFLEADGYDILSSASGEEAVNAAKKSDVHLLLMDAHMPGDLDGRQTLEEIRKLGRNPVPIMISGHDSLGSGLDDRNPGESGEIDEHLQLRHVRKKLEEALVASPVVV